MPQPVVPELVLSPSLPASAPPRPARRIALPPLFTQRPVMLAAARRRPAATDDALEARQLPGWKTTCKTRKA